MKKILFLLKCTFLINCVLKAQNPSFGCKDLTIHNNSANSSSFCKINFSDFQFVPEITLQVNFHVTSNPFSTPIEAVAAVKKLLDNMNIVLSSFDSYKVANTTFPISLVPKAKIKLKLYSESANTNDSYGGIWLYSTGPAFYVNQYPGKVLNIELRSNNTGHQNGETDATDYIWAEDFYTWRNDSPRFFPSLVIHEVGHALGLSHPEWCSNECAGIDIDPVFECNANCADANGNRCTPTEDRNNGGLQCNNNTSNLCNSCDRSNLLTSACYNYPRAMTPCQWEKIFNNVLQNYLSHYSFALLCFTAPTFILNSSPLNDYRASQSITSTSIVSGDRMVDYWSPTINLNSGFNVQLGTTFIASPTTFPCCASTQNLIAASSKNPLDKTLNVKQETVQETVDVSKISLKVYPSPAKGELFIDYNLSGTSTTSLSVINITGEVVQTVKQPEEQQQGHYKIGINVTNYQNGVYFIYLETASGKTVEKFVVQK